MKAVRPLEQVGQRGLDQGLAGRVQRAGCLVEDDQGRLLAQGAGDRQPLPLALAELVAPLADDRGIALGQCRGEFVDHARPGPPPRPARRRPPAPRTGCCPPGSAERRPGLARPRRSGGGACGSGGRGSARRPGGSRPRSGRRTASGGSPACSCRSRWARPGRSSCRARPSAGCPRRPAPPRGSRSRPGRTRRPRATPSRDRAATRTSSGVGSTTSASRSRISPSRSTLAAVCSKT